MNGRGRISCHGTWYCSLLVGENKHELLSPLMTAQFFAQMVLHNVGVAENYSKNLGTEIEKYNFYKAQIRV